MAPQWGEPQKSACRPSPFPLPGRSAARPGARVPMNLPLALVHDKRPAGIRQGRMIAEPLPSYNAAVHPAQRPPRAFQSRLDAGPQRHTVQRGNRIDGPTRDSALRIANGREGPPRASLPSIAVNPSDDGEQHRQHDAVIDGVHRHGGEQRTTPLACERQAQGNRQSTVRQAGPEDGSPRRSGYSPKRDGYARAGSPSRCRIAQVPIKHAAKQCLFDNRGNDASENEDGRTIHRVPVRDPFDHRMRWSRRFLEAGGWAHNDLLDPQ